MTRVFHPTWREKAHEKLDEILDMYEQGVPLWIHTTFGWDGTSLTGVQPGELSMTIREWWA
jgi:hypothetical protein